MRPIPTYLAMAITAGACASAPVDPYDEDLAYCRRATVPPPTMANASVNFQAATYVRNPELVPRGEQMRSCMAGRFQERFPGVPLPPELR